MFSFSYVARDSRAEQVNGAIQAKNPQEAIRQLQRSGHTVLRLSADGGAAVSSQIDPDRIALRRAAASVHRDEVIDFAAQLAIMLETGVTLSEALAAYISQCKGGAGGAGGAAMRKVAEAVQERVIGGETLSGAMAQFPRVFPSLMVSLVTASEASGAMASMLGRIAGYLAKERRAIRQIRGALTYPAIMLVMSSAVMFFLVGWVLPRFARIYASRSAALPRPTQILLTVSNYLSSNWVWIVGGAAVLTAVTIVFAASVRGRYLIDSAKVAMPIIGPIYRRYYLTRATRTLATLLAAGVQLLDAIRIVSGVTGNVRWAGLWQELETSITTGSTVAAAVVNSPLIPPSAAQMIAAGERSGRLPEVLERIAQASEEELDDAIKHGTQLIEPAMIIFMGIGIGSIAIALLLPIFSIASTVTG